MFQKAIVLLLMISGIVLHDVVQGIRPESQAMGQGTNETPAKIPPNELHQKILDQIGYCQSVGTNEKGEITQIELWTGKSMGIDPVTLKQVALISTLEYLDLSNRGILDDHLEHLATLTSLKKLIVRRSSISGSGLIHLKNLKELELLEMTQSPLEDEHCHYLKQFSNLKSLNVSMSSITDEALTDIGQLGSLTNLNLEGTNIGSSLLGKLSGLLDIEILKLPKNAAGEGLVDLAPLSNLSELNFGKVHKQQSDNDSNISFTFKLLVDKQKHSVEEAVAILAWRHETLEGQLLDLTVYGSPMTPRIDDRVIPFLRQLKSMRRLAFIGTEITDQGIAEFEPSCQLHDLNLRGTKCSGESLKSLVKFENLNTLVAPEGITNGQLSYLKGRESLLSLDLSFSPIKSRGLLELKASSKLNHLNLSETQVRDKAISILGMFPLLESLDVSSTRISDASLEPIGNLVHLSELSLNETQVTDEGIQHLGKLTKLRKLETSDTNVTQAGRVKLLHQVMKLDPIDVLKIEGGEFNTKSDGLFSLILAQDSETSDLHLEVASRINGLQEIRMYYEPVTVAGIRSLKNLQSLEVLYCYKCKELDDAAIKEIAKIESLKTLTIMGSEKITDSGIMRIAALKNLKSMTISIDNISVETEEELRRLLPKCEIRFI